jgi:hypothetical protein
MCVEEEEKSEVTESEQAEKTNMLM